MVVNTEDLSPRRQKIRKRIITAADEVFSSNGYFSSSIAMIAKKAGLADGTMYLYFESKEDLFLSIINDYVDELLEYVHNIMMTVTNPIEKVFKFIDANIDYFTANPKRAKMIVVELHYVKNFNLTQDGFSAYYKYITYIRNTCEYAIDKGFIREMDGDYLSQMIFALIDYMVRIWVYSDYKADIQTIKSRMVNILVYGIVRY